MIVSRVAVGEGPWAPVLRLARPLGIALTVVLGVAAAAVIWSVFAGAASRGDVGFDANLYLTSAQRWLATGEFYYPAQLAGPYVAEHQVMLYPPVSLYLFLPMSFVPRVLWWVVPLTVLVAHAWTARPAWWTWPIVAGLCATVPIASGLAYGNTDMWNAAAVAVACRFAPAAWFLIIKPTIFPVALLFARDKRWWLAIPLVVVACLPFGALWLDYITVVRNLTGTGLTYSLNGILTWVAIPLIVWAGRTRRSVEG